MDLLVVSWISFVGMKFVVPCQAAISWLERLVLGNWTMQGFLIGEREDLFGRVVDFVRWHEIRCPCQAAAAACSGKFKFASLGSSGFAVGKTKGFSPG